MTSYGSSWCPSSLRRCGPCPSCTHRSAACDAVRRSECLANQASARARAVTAGLPEDGAGRARGQHVCGGLRQEHAGPRVRAVGRRGAARAGDAQHDRARGRHLHAHHQQPQPGRRQQARCAAAAGHGRGRNAPPSRGGRARAATSIINSLSPAADSKPGAPGGAACIGGTCSLQGWPRGLGRRHVSWR